MTRATARRSAPHLEWIGRTADFRAAVQDFDGFGSQTQILSDGGIPYLVNEYWTAGQRQAHSIHEVSYRACFKPQLPQFFIDRLTGPGDGVYDPFMGRGTTVVQAALQGRRPLGNDINPLSVLLARPRLTPPSLAQIGCRLAEVPWASPVACDERLLAFYHPDTLQEITALHEFLERRAPLHGEPDPIDDWIRMVALNRLTGHSPGFFSVYSLPPNQAVSIGSQQKINAKRNQVPPYRPVAELILRKSKALLADGAPSPHPPAVLGSQSASRASFIPDGSAKLVVTSPPFLDVVQYSADNWLRCWFAGIDAEKVGISHHRSLSDWSEMVRECLTDLARILEPNGHVAFEVGEVRNGEVLLERIVWQAMAGLPFERLFVLVNQQEFTKTSNCWGIRNNAKGTNSNRIVLARRY
jgi:hypothetical protein